LSLSVFTLYSNPSFCFAKHWFPNAAYSGLSTATLLTAAAVASSTAVLADRFAAAAERQASSA